jgi:hypothetical protein
MEQAIMHGETGERLIRFQYEYDLSGSYDYSEFNDFTQELMKENIDLQKELLIFFEPLKEEEIHRIINIQQNVADSVTLLQSDPELMRSYFNRK